MSGQNSPPPPRPQSFSRLMALAMELPFILVGSVILAGAVGYVLDDWLGTRPAFLFLLGLLGFFAGLRELLRRFGTGGGKTNGNRPPP